MAFIPKTFLKLDFLIPYALVLSSVGEEGLDIPSADLVVFYEPVPSEIRYIQRKGRTGRVRVGRAIVLVANGTVDGAYVWVSLRKAKRMEEIMGKLKSELQPIPRGPEPPLSPMPAEAMAPERIEPEEIRTPDEIQKEGARLFRHELGQNVKRVLSEVLTSPGISIEQISDRLGVSISDVRVAVEKLVEENLLIRAGENVWPTGSQQGVVRTFEVEKVLEGKAIVRVNEKWYAILDSADYKGPRALIKTGSRFKAASEFFHVGDKLHAKIFSVVQSLEGSSAEGGVS